MTENLAARGEGLAGLVAERDRINVMLAEFSAKGRDCYDSMPYVVGKRDGINCAIAALEAAAPASTAQIEVHNESTPGAVKPEPLVYRQSASWTGKEACRKELFSRGETHYCHLLRDHEGDCEWFYSEKQLCEELHLFAVKYRKAEEPIREAALSWFDKYYNQVVLTKQLLEAQAAALATPSPQAPQEQCRVFSTTSAREQSSATASGNLSVGDEVWIKSRVIAKHEVRGLLIRVDGVGEPVMLQTWVPAEHFDKLRAATQEQPAGSGGSLKVGDWFFHDSPSCTRRYSVQEKTESGCSIVCSTPYVHEGAKCDMELIAKLHNAAGSPRKVGGPQRSRPGARSSSVPVGEQKQEEGV